MKKLFFVFVILSSFGCSNPPKEIVTLPPQKVVIEQVDYLGYGKYQVYFSYKWKDGHMIGTGIMVDRPMSVGETKNYIEYSLEDEYGQKTSYQELRD